MFRPVLSESCVMLRFKFLIAAVPLIAVAAIIARLEASPAAAPCVAVGTGASEPGSQPWVADLHVDFTDDPRLATVRVGLAETAAAADLVLVDDGPEAEDNACGITGAVQSVALAAEPAARAPLVYLAQDGPADYRVFVQSGRFSQRDAAALVVRAHADDRRVIDQRSAGQRLADAAP
jgi:hypothetical protein